MGNCSGQKIVITNIEPKIRDIANAWDQLKCKECGFNTRKSFIDYMFGEDLHYYPIILSYGGKIEALIYLDDYNPLSATSNIHFITAKTISNPTALIRQARRVIGSIMANGDIDTLLAFIPVYQSRAPQVAKLLGFKVIKEGSRCTCLYL